MSDDRPAPERCADCGGDLTVLLWAYDEEDGRPLCQRCGMEAASRREAIAPNAADVARRVLALFAELDDLVDEAEEVTAAYEAHLGRYVEWRERAERVTPPPRRSDDRQAPEVRVLRDALAELWQVAGDSLGRPEGWSIPMRELHDELPGRIVAARAEDREADDA